MRESLLGLPVYEYAALFEKPRTLRRRAASHRPGDALPEARLRRRVGGRDAFFGSTGPTADTVFTGTRYDLHEGLEDGAERRRSSWAARPRLALRRPCPPWRTARRSRGAPDDVSHPVWRLGTKLVDAADRRCAARRCSYAPRRRACAGRRVAGVAPAPGADLARPPSDSAGAAADRRCAAPRWAWTPSSSRVWARLVFVA